MHLVSAHYTSLQLQPACMRSRCVAFAAELKRSASRRSSASIRAHVLSVAAGGPEGEEALPSSQPLSVLGVDPDTHGACALLSLASGEAAAAALELGDRLGGEGAGVSFCDEIMNVVVVDTPIKLASCPAPPVRFLHGLNLASRRAVRMTRRGVNSDQVNFTNSRGTASRPRIDVVQLFRSLQNLDFPPGTVAFLEQARVQPPPI